MASQRRLDYTSALDRSMALVSGSWYLALCKQREIVLPSNASPYQVEAIEYNQDFYAFFPFLEFGFVL